MNNQEDIKKKETEITPEQNDKAGLNKCKSSMTKVIVGVAAAIVLVAALIITLGGSKSDSDKLISSIDDLQAKNAYIQLMIGPEQYIYLLYNKDGEAIAESSGGGLAFYRNDNKIVTMTDTEVIIDSDMSPLEFIKATVKVANDKNSGTIETEVTTDTEKKTKNTLYTVTVNGKENIQKIYDTLGDENYSKASIEMLYSGFEDVESSSLVIRISTGENGELGAACNVKFGEGEENEYTSWTFDGYIPTFDWALDTKWYSNDTTTVSEWLDLANTTIDEISNSMAQFMQESNLTTDTTKTGGITYEQYTEMSDAEKDTTISDAIADIETVGYTVTAEKSDIRKSVEDFYASGKENQGINLLQALINVGVEQGWLAETFTDVQPEGQTTEPTEEQTGENTGEAKENTENNVNTEE